MQGLANDDDWVSLGLRWAAEDPDPETAQSMRSIIASGDVGALRDCFLPLLEFGTAGLRGVVCSSAQANSEAISIAVYCQTVPLVPESRPT